MTKYLPPHLKSLFQARPEPRFLAPPERKAAHRGYSGVAETLARLRGEGKLGEKEKKDKDEIEAVRLDGEDVEEEEGEKTKSLGRDGQGLGEKLTASRCIGDAARGDCDARFPPQLPPRPAHRVDAMLARQQSSVRERARVIEEKELAAWEEGRAAYGGDALKTLFVGRMNYDTTAWRLRCEFEQFGPIVEVNIVKDSETGRPRGYAFIEFERERDMYKAYEAGNGLKIDGERVLVDVERGRTVRGWRPRRLGGGLGERRPFRPRADYPVILNRASVSSMGGPSGGRFGGRFGGERDGGHRDYRDRGDHGGGRSSYHDRRGGGGGGRYDDRERYDDRSRRGAPYERHDRRPRY